MTDEKINTNNIHSLKSFFSSYLLKVKLLFDQVNLTPIFQLTNDLRNCWKKGQRLFICGNGGSAANALHLANDFLYGVDGGNGKGIKAQALSANVSALTCIANDLDYSNIFSKQLEILGEEGDLLLALSGSGNSKNIQLALKQADIMKIKSYAILGFDGGKSKQLTDVAIHLPIHDMQIAEDLQLIIGHMLVQWLYKSSLQELNDKKNYSQNIETTFY